MIISVVRGISSVPLLVSAGLSGICFGDVFFAFVELVLGDLCPFVVRHFVGGGRWSSSVSSSSDEFSVDDGFGIQNAISSSIWVLLVAGLSG